VQHVPHSLELRDEPVWILSVTHPGYLNPLAELGLFRHFAGLAFCSNNIRHGLDPLAISIRLRAAVSALV
jgi:hypothetical protein